MKALIPIFDTAKIPKIAKKKSTPLIIKVKAAAVFVPNAKERKTKN